MRLALRVSRESLWRRAQQSVRIEDVRGKLLEPLGLVLMDSKMAKVELRMGPGHFQRALGRPQIRVFLGKSHCIFTGFGNAGDKGDLRRFSRVQRYPPP